MTLVNALYSLAVGLLFGIAMYVVAFLFPATRPLMVCCWRMSPVGTIMGCAVVGLLASMLFIIFGWWILSVWFLFTLCSHLVVEMKRQLSKPEES
jgi:hypothetical protein